MPFKDGCIYVVCFEKEVTFSVFHYYFMKKPIPQDIWDLWEYSFLQTLIKRKSKRLIKQIAESGSLFIPVNDSINFHLHISDIRFIFIFLSYT